SRQFLKETGETIEYTAFTAITSCFQLKISQLSRTANLAASGNMFGALLTGFAASQAPRSSAESTKEGRRARDKVRKRSGTQECRILSLSHPDGRSCLYGGYKYAR